MAVPGVPGFDNYFLFSTGAIERSGGAVGLRGESTGEKLRIYVTVDSLDDTLPKVAGLGWYLALRRGGVGKVLQ